MIRTQINCSLSEVSCCYIEIKRKSNCFVYSKKKKKNNLTASQEKYIVTASKCSKMIAIVTPIMVHAFFHPAFQTLKTNCSYIQLFQPDFSSFSFFLRRYGKPPSCCYCLHFMSVPMCSKQMRFPLCLPKI